MVGTLFMHKLSTTLQEDMSITKKKIQIQANYLKYAMQSFKERQYIWFIVSIEIWNLILQWHITVCYCKCHTNNNYVALTADEKLISNKSVL